MKKIILIIFIIILTSCGKDSTPEDIQITISRHLDTYSYCVNPQTSYSGCCSHSEGIKYCKQGGIRVKRSTGKIVCENGDYSKTCQI